jgi:hypothetical protein
VRVLRSNTISRTAETVLLLKFERRELRGMSQLLEGL